MRRVRRSLVRLALTCATVLPSLQRPVLAGDAEAENRIARAARIAFSAVIDRVDSYSFEYRQVAWIGPLPAGNPSTSEPFVLARPTGVTPGAWSVGEWSRLLDAARIAWRDKRTLESCEYVRRVVRNADACLDIDQGLAIGKIERPTASAIYRSSVLSASYEPLAKGLSVRSARVDPGDSPNGKYFLLPVPLAFKGNHKVYRVSVGDASGGSVIRMAGPDPAGAQVHEYTVSEAIGFLPTRCVVRVGGEVAMTTEFQWMKTPDGGYFPAAVARVERGKKEANLRLTVFANPQGGSAPVPPVTVSVGTWYTDQRFNPPRAGSLSDGAELPAELAPVIRVGPVLDVPRRFLMPDSGGSSSDAIPLR